MEPLIVIPIALAVALGSAFVVNEWSEGRFAESMGAGHHHMQEPTTHECAAHSAHVHGAGAHAHGSCTLERANMTHPHMASHSGGRPA